MLGQASMSMKMRHDWDAGGIDRIHEKLHRYA